MPPSEDPDMLKTSVLAVALLSLAVAAPAKAAESQVKSGVLTCNVDSGWGFVVGSSRNLRCVFTGGNRVERYTGEIKKFGIDIGYLQSGVIIWGVVAPTTNLGAGALAGEYGGITAGAAVGIGANANVLVGGSDKSISLQPLSIEGDKGINIAAGIGTISLILQP